MKNSKKTKKDFDQIFVTIATVVNEDINIIDSFIKSVSKILNNNFKYYELLIIDNGSTDGTNEKIIFNQKKKSNIRLIRLSKKYDIETAMAAAFENSIGDYVVFMESDGDPPDLIPELLENIINGYDIVFGRIINNRESKNIIKIWIESFFVNITSKIMGYPMDVNSSYFRIMSRRAVNSIIKIRDKKQFTNYFSLLVGYKRKHFDYERKFIGHKNQKKSKLTKTFIFYIDLIFSNSSIPLRFISILGLVASFLNLAYFGWIFGVLLLKDGVIGQGWITTNIVTTTMFFVLFVMFSILAEYIARILKESKDQPLYFVESESNSKVLSYKEDKEEKQLNVM